MAPVRDIWIVPFAVCNTRSIRYVYLPRYLSLYSADARLTETNVESTGENSVLHHSPGHGWFHLSNQQMSEVWLYKNQDSRRATTQTSWREPLQLIPLSPASHQHIHRIHPCYLNSRAHAYLRASQAFCPGRGQVQVVLS